jgi:hypothetical protein
MGAMGGRCALGLLLLLGGCPAELANVPVDADGASDGSGMKQPDGGNNMTDAPVMLGPWGAPEKVIGADSTLDEDDATMSSTKLELYFKRNDPNGAGGFESNLYVMTRNTVTSAWSDPQALTVLNSTVSEESPRLTENDLTMYFGRGGDIYKTTRTAIGSSWGAATAVASLNTAANEKWAVVCSNGYAMVSRAVTNQGQDVFEGDINAGANTNVTQLNSITNEQGIFLTSDCLHVYFQSNRDNNQFNIFTASRTSMQAPWGNPNAMTDFNTATFNEEDPWQSTDQRTFVFTSNSSGNKDVYISTR